MNVTDTQTFGAKISECERIFGYKFKSKLLCAEAINCVSSVCVVESHLRRIPKNDRLAVYGATVLTAYSCKIWLDRNQEKSEWAKIRLEVLGNKKLAQIGRQLGLEACMNVNNGTVTISPGMITATIEAIIGAVDKDGGSDASAGVMKRIGIMRQTLPSPLDFSPIF